MTKLKEFRKFRGMTQAKLSEISGVNLRTLQDYEQGSKDINKVAGITLYKLAQALNCRVEDLLEIKPEEPVSFEVLSFKELLGE